MLFYYWRGPDGLPLWEIRGIRTHRFEPMSSQINGIQIYTSRFLSRCSRLLEYNKDWLAQCKDNVTEWDISMVLAAWSPSGSAL